MTDIKAVIDEKIKDLPKDIQMRMDGLDGLVVLMQTMGIAKDENALIDYLIERQKPKNEKDKRFVILEHKDGRQYWKKEEAVYQYLKTVYEGLKEEDKEQFAQDLATMFKEENINVPTTILKFLALKQSDKIEFASKDGRYYLALDGLEIASMCDEEQTIENCQDFSFVSVQKGLRGLGLGNILLHNYLKQNYLQNEENKAYTIRAYGVGSENIVAQNLYYKFGADFLDENDNIISQEQFQATGMHLCMLFSNEALQVVAEQPIRTCVSFDAYAQKHFASALEDASERVL